MTPETLMHAITALQVALVQQWAAGDGSERWRYSLALTHYAGDTRSPGLVRNRGQHQGDVIALTPAVAALLAQRWPRSAARTGRSPQTVRGLLREVGGRRAVQAAEQQFARAMGRVRELTAYAAELWHDRTPPQGWLLLERVALEDRSMFQAAIASDLDALRARRLLEIDRAAAAPWVERVREEVDAFAERLRDQLRAGGTRSEVVDGANTRAAFDAFLVGVQDVAVMLVGNGLATAAATDDVKRPWPLAAMRGQLHVALEDLWHRFNVDMRTARMLDTTMEPAAGVVAAAHLLDWQQLGAMEWRLADTLWDIVQVEVFTTTLRRAGT